MSISLKDLRKKIKSIQGTKKLTQAMQMVAASKMQKSIDRTQMTRGYANLAWEIVKNIRSRTDITQHPLLKKREDKTIALILITSNRGLCGGLNAQVLRKISAYIKEKEKSGVKTEIITVGSKGKIYISRYFKNMLVADFPAPDRLVEFSDSTAISKLVIDDYISEKYDRVCVFYNHFVSTLRQEPIRRQILSIPNLTELEEYQLAKGEKLKIEDPCLAGPRLRSSTDSDRPESIEGRGSSDSRSRQEKSKMANNESTNQQSNHLTNIEYKFEPETKSILDVLLPRIIETQLYQILLESNASEHSARMVAMKNATDNAGDLIEDLQLTYNSARQAAITGEIAEIAAGAEALRA